MLIFSFLLSYFVKLGVPFEKIPAILVFGVVLFDRQIKNLHEPKSAFKNVF